MASSVATQRLRKELKALQKEPVANIRALPHESNVLEWHYVIEGGKGTPYEGGWYHGVVKFPKEYPFKPPAIEMYTPNGRFKTNTKLCLSMSDFHPETWNPLWSVGTILTGLYSFMLEEGSTYGSIVTPLSQKRQAAAASLAYNVENKMFAELFPELVDMHKEEVAKAAAAAAAAAASSREQDGGGVASAKSSATASAGAVCPANGNAGNKEDDNGNNGLMSWFAVISIFVVVVASTAAIPLLLDS